MSHPFRHLVAMSTVGLLFVGGVAAAATGTNPLSPLLGTSEDAGPSLTTTTTTTTTIGTTTTTGAPVALATEVVCDEDAANHGEAVSAVATDADTVGADHGAAVSEMAKSDCGKVAVEDETEAQPEPAPAEDELTFQQICDGAENHGEAVSTVAKNKSTVGAEHGAAVSEMAKSDCGKTDASDNDQDEDDDDDGDAPAAANKSSKKHVEDTGGPQGS
ncbi:MAG: hypothetical protein ABI658_07180 [Acidimicrobiales bacterium]